MLFVGYAKAHPSKTRQDCQNEITQIWNNLKKQDNVPAKVESLLKQYEAMGKQKKGSMLSYWATQTLRSDSPAACKHVVQSPVYRIVEETKREFEMNTQCDDTPPALACVTEVMDSGRKTKTKTKVQDELKVQVDILKSDLVGLYKRKSSGFITNQQDSSLKEKKIKLDQLEKQLTLKKREQERQRKSRQNKKEVLAKLCMDNPEIGKALKVRQKIGRPAIEVEQPLFLKAIVDIALYGSAAHEKRQSDIYRSVRTLDELTEQLNKDGFDVCRSAVYTRLLPRKSSSLEGRRHITTVPVKLIRAQNDAHTKHIDGQFCTSTIRHLEELASLLGPLEVCFISQDDKARVPIGLTAANKQAPLVMHVEYRVVLPDHDWVVAARHKLIPSVYAGIEIKENGLGNPEAVGYSGPTYIALRSGKHAMSSAFSHGLDFERLLELPQFDSITKDQRDNNVKPVVIFSVDGGPDENPRYQKVIDVGIHHFVKHDLDALFIATNAPGRSAFNRVERRMAPLSRELSGLILSHQHFGSHLDSQGRTINEELEKSNFKFAGDTLAEIWSGMMIDGHPTVAEYVNPVVSELDGGKLIVRDQKWFHNHVRTSQYMTQIVKCKDMQCCHKSRSSFFKILGHHQFLPPPIPLCQTREGLKAPQETDGVAVKFPSLFVALVLTPGDILPTSREGFIINPYDLYCPSVQTLLAERMCKVCNIYFASQAMLRKHACEHRHHSLNDTSVVPRAHPTRPVRVAARRQRELMAVIASEENGECCEWVDEQDVDVAGISVPEDLDILPTVSVMPIIDISEHLTSPWEEC